MPAKNPYEGLRYHEAKRGFCDALLHSVVRSLCPKGGKLRRRDETKKELEFRQAALFALGRAAIDPTLSVHFAMTVDECNSADAIIRFKNDQKSFSYETVQLKEIVPGSVDPHQTLEGMLKDLERKYGSGEMLTVAINLNRDLVTTLGAISAPKIKGVTFWLFGISEQNIGFIVKNPFETFKVSDFELPRMPSSLTQW